MKVLILGAGAVGGYFGGRLAQAGADVTFLVRPQRAQKLAQSGLVIHSPMGDAQIPVRTVLKETVRPDFDLVILSCKAYDLDASIASLAGAMGPTTLVLPLLNGMAHLARLEHAFGSARVLGFDVNKQTAEVLKRIKGDPRTAGIPVVVLTSSSEERDVMKTYEVGANSYIIKPVDFEQFTESVRDIGKYWLEINHAQAS